MPVHVEVHRQWDGRNPERTQPPSTLTPYVASMTWSETVAPPWGGLELTLRPTATGPNPPSQGDWVVIRSAPNAPAMALYHVTHASDGQAAKEDGTIAEEPVHIVGEPWLQVMARVHTYTVANTHTDDSRVGTFVLPMERARFMEAASKALSEGLGAGLEALVQVAGYFLLPPSLGGKFSATSKAIVAYATEGLLGKSLAVVWNPDAAAETCADGRAERAGVPARRAEYIPGFGMPDFQALGGAQGVSCLDLIQGTFSADPNMVEMFPSLEDSPRGDGGPPDKGPAKALGRTPCLIYRVRPWRGDHLVTYARKLGYGQAIDAGLFDDDITWDLSRAQVVPENDVFRIGRSVDINEYYNAFTVSLPMAPGSEIQYLLGAQLPVFRARNVALFGARLYEVNWPFFGDLGTESKPGKKPSGIEIVNGIPFRHRKAGEEINKLVLHDTGGFSLAEKVAYVKWYAEAKALSGGKTHVDVGGKQVKLGYKSSHYIIDENGDVLDVAAKQLHAATDFLSLADIPMSGLLSPETLRAIHASGWNKSSIGIDVVSSGNRKKAGASRAARFGKSAYMWVVGTALATDFVDVVHYTAEQVAALRHLVALLRKRFPTIPAKLLWGPGYKRTTYHGAEPGTFKGILSHAQTPKGNYDGNLGLEALWTTGTYTAWGP
jgi:hypothetical protein